MFIFLFLHSCINLCNFFLYLGIDGGVYLLIYERNDSLSIASEISRINQNIAAAYTACSEKGATLPSEQNSDHLADTIDSIVLGGSIRLSDVNFFDSDGSLLHSYTFAEVLELTALPALPQREGLVAQEWNYTLSQIHSAAREGCTVDVGCTYKTDDNCTRLCFFIAKGTRIPTLRLRLRLDPNTSVTVDWGDGTDTMLSNTGSSQVSTYAEKTDYTDAEEDTTICVRLIGGKFALGRESGGNMFEFMCFIISEFHAGSNCVGILSRAFEDCVRLTDVTLSASVTMIGSSAFKHCDNLKSLVIPSNIDSVNASLFAECYEMERVSIPASVTTIGENTFLNCYDLHRISIPIHVERIKDNAFKGCRSLSNIVIPSDVTSIGSSAFGDCHGLNRVVIPPSAARPYGRAFENCFGLQEVIFSPRLTYISKEECHNCWVLTHVTIPSSVLQIKDGAFNYCDSLYLVDLTAFTDPSAIPTLDNSNAFPSAVVEFKVADQAMLGAFSAASNWSTYANKFTV